MDLVALGYAKNISKKVDEHTAQLAEITHQLVTWSLMGTGLSTSIASALPSVTLADVQTLEPTATLEDTADWYCLQKTITNIKALTETDKKRFMPKQGVYILSKPLRISGKIRNLLFEAYGVYFKPKSGYTDYLLELSTLDEGLNYPQGIYIKGLEVNGMFKSKGVKIDFAQEWNFDDIVVRNCTTGYLLKRTWYGSLAGENRIWNCLNGMQLGEGETDNSAEVNTIDFTNLKINFSETYKGAGWFNTTNDSVGIAMNCRIFGIKTYGITIEGTDYGYLGKKAKDGTQYDVKFDILNNYFEAIKKIPINFLPDPATRDIFARVKISGCRLSGSDYSTFVAIGHGDYRIFNNFGYVSQKITALATSTYPGYYLETDSKPSDVTTVIYGATLPYNSHIRNKIRYIENDQYDWKTYSPYSVNNPTNPRYDNAAATQQDLDFLVSLDATDSVTNTQAKYYNMYSPSNRDITFMRPELGVVLKDRINGKWYRLKIENGTLAVEEEVNKQKLFERIDAKRSKWFELTPAPENEYRMNVEFAAVFYGKSGRWMYKPTGVEYPIYATGGEIAAVNPGAGYQQPIFNKEIHKEYGWENGFWGYGHLNWGSRTQKRAVGTTAQRPTGVSTGFIYYDTDIVGYVQWNGTAWVSYTPS